MRDEDQTDSEIIEVVGESVNHCNRPACVSLDFRCEKALKKSKKESENLDTQ